MTHAGASALTVVLASFALSSCSSVASFKLFGKPTDPPTVDDLVTHIQCEIWKAKEKSGMGKLSDFHYVAFAQLTVDVTNFEGSAPQLNFINPYLTPMTNLTYTVGGQLTGTQHRNLTQAFTIDVSVTQDGARDTCVNRAEGSRLNGDLGLESVIREGLEYVASSDFRVFPLPKDDGDPAKLSQTNLPVFGSTVDFTVVYGINNVGPTWTLTRFKGPGGGSGGGGSGGGTGAGGANSGGGAGGSAQGLLTLTRTHKDTLVISFAPACAQAGCPKTAGAAAFAPAPPPSVTSEEFVSESATVQARLDETLRRLNAQVSALSVPAAASEAQKASVATTQALAGTTLALAEAVNVLKKQSEVQTQFTEALRNATPVPPSPVQLAVTAAQDNNTRIILQNLLTSP